MCCHCSSYVITFGGCPCSSVIPGAALRLCPSRMVAPNAVVRWFAVIALVTHVLRRCFSPNIPLSERSQVPLCSLAAVLDSPHCGRRRRCGAPGRCRAADHRPPAAGPDPPGWRRQRRGRRRQVATGGRRKRPWRVSGHLTASRAVPGSCGRLQECSRPAVTCYLHSPG